MPVDDTYLLLDEESLRIERQQATAEGRALSEIEDVFERVRRKVSENPHDHQESARELLEQIQTLPYRTDYEYEEPSELGAIREKRPDGPRTMGAPDGVAHDEFLGAWLGRCSGCLLGKPVEGWASDRLWGFLRDTDNYPLSRYISSDMTDEVWEEYDWADEPTEDTAFVDRIDHMVRDDDIDYTIAGLALVSDHGLGFDSNDVAAFWLSNLPALNTYTAERITYRNLLELVDPPRSARYCNPYREGIGAQIRADFYGYVCAGSPELAAELAWRDARISHVKNGIYGAMWVAAMLAAAPSLEDRTEVVRVGLSEVPTTSRLADAVEDVLDWHDRGVSYDEAVDRIHERWTEASLYGWLHAIANAQIVTVGLLWGDEFSRSICRAVQAGFDTDCNGATVGSVVGMMRGAEALPDEWTDPLGETVESSLTAYPRESISELARTTADLHRRHA